MEKLVLINIAELVVVRGFAAKKGKEMSQIDKINNAYLEIEGERISSFGQQKDYVKKPDAKVIDCAGKTVLPGFIDSHSHFVFGGYRADEFNWRLQGQKYMEIMNKGGGIAATTTATKSASKKELIHGALGRLKLALSQGVTTMEGKSGYGLDLDTEIKQLEVMKELNDIQDIDVVSTFMGAHATPKGEEPKEYIKFICDEVLPVVAKRRLAEFCDVFCEPNVFDIEMAKQVLLKAKKLGLKTKIHADEIVSIGGSEMAAEINSSSADHLLQIPDGAIRKLAESNTIATLLPLTAFCLKENYAPARKLIDNGCAVALASDLNPGSCHCQNISLLIAISAIYMNMTIEEIVTALTINAAAAIGREKTIGSIDIGKVADIIILEWPSINYLPYHTASNSVVTVIKNGKIVFEQPEGFKCGMK